MTNLENKKQKTKQNETEKKGTYLWRNKGINYSGLLGKNALREWIELFKVLEEKSLQLRIL